MLPRMKRHAFSSSSMFINKGFVRPCQHDIVLFRNVYKFNDRWQVNRIESSTHIAATTTAARTLNITYSIDIIENGGFK